MKKPNEDNFAFVAGFIVSLFGHLLGALFTVMLLHHQAATASKPAEIFSVTLEGGEKLGGVTQVPDENPAQEKQKIKDIPAPPEEDDTDPAPLPEQTAKKEIDRPTLVDEAKQIEEKKKEEEKKALEEKRKIEEEAKKKKLEEEKKKIEQEKLKELEAKKQKEKDKLLRDAQLMRALAAAKRRYRGESANAGGEGFGAAALGGQGFGGGILASREFIAYQLAIKEHIKRGWHWVRAETVFEAKVMVRMTRDGTIEQVELVQSSGNEQYDESVIRAVYKATPLPAPPENLYDKFREVRITFNSHE